MSLFTLIVVAIRAKLKTCLLAIIMVYYLYVSSKYESTGNYKSTRRLCLSHNKRCVEPSETISLTELQDYNGGIYSICVDAKRITDIKPCFEAEKLDNFISEISKTEYTNVNLLDYIAVENDYMYYNNWVVALCIIGLVLSTLFENTAYVNECFVDLSRGAFLNEETKVYIRRLLIVVLCLVVFIMIRIIAYYSLKFQMKCIRPIDDKTNEFCSLLHDSDVHINFLIFPTDLIVKPYKNISILLVSFLILGLIIYKENPHTIIRDMLRERIRNNRVYADANADALANDNYSDEDNNGLFGRFIDAHHTGGSRLRVSQLHSSSSSSTSSEQGRGRTQTSLSDSISANAERQRIFARMKIHKNLSSCGSSECSICLCDLFPNSTGGDVTIASFSAPSKENASQMGSSCVTAPLSPHDVESQSNGGNLTRNEAWMQDDILETDCGHIFHKSCIIKWYVKSTHKTCPVCRAEIK